jgi:ribonuclease G
MKLRRQLRLRDMGGIIVVDFIDMQTNEHKQMLYRPKMKEAHVQPTGLKIISFRLSKFGLMQITRQTGAGLKCISILSEILPFLSWNW